MTHHHTLMAAYGRPALRGGFGVSGQYLVPGAAAFACIAQVGPEEQVEDDDGHGRKLVTEMSATFSIGVADPLNGALDDVSPQHKVTLSGATWYVLKVLQRTGSQAVLRLRLSKRLHNERPGLVARP